MKQPFPRGDVTFDVIHHDGWIRVCITEGVATIYIDNINDHQIVVKAIRKAIAAGGQRGTMFTGEIVNDRLAAKHIRRAEFGTTWLDGKVIRLEDGEDGPQFRIDWDALPDITD